ncbi:MAG TPA: cytochrome c oxidase subunit 3 [Bryobacteraceae bacterium]|nr:cytochrome c oxidase subunit 3 [Bryobacteraceae bacterium]
MQHSIEAAEPKSSISLGMFGMILILAAIGAFFVALAVAYAFAIQDRPGQANVHLSIWFWISTALLLLSSVTLQWARRDLRLARLQPYRNGLWATLWLGVLFLVTQLLGCRDLAAQGVYVVGNPRGSMYFMFSGVHAAHLLGGLGGLYWLIRKAKQLTDGEEQPLRRHRAAARNTAVYWHFMGGLWVGLLALLVAWQ